MSGGSFDYMYSKIRGTYKKVDITCSIDSFPTMDIEFMVCGDMTMQEVNYDTRGKV